MSNPIIITHGGAGANAAHADGPETAAKLALALLIKKQNALEAVIKATCVLEDDPRFNAGTGSNLRLDGALIEMDAAVMTSDGKSGAVANLAAVKNPVQVAAKVRELTPHLLIAGEGALRFARRLGFAPYDPATEEARKKLAWARRGLQGLEDDDEEFGKWKDIDIKKLWNFEADADQCLGDTVGAVARDCEGNFAAAASTGGTLVMLRGRIGDTPLIGSGLYAGPAGAVTTTGVGEEIVQKFLAKMVYDQIAAGVPAQQACESGVALYSKEVGIGVLAVAHSSHGIASNRSMPSAFLTDKL